MSRNNYPFKKRDIDFGLKLISTLFIIPLGLCALASTKSSTTNRNNYNVTNQPHNLHINSLKKYYITWGILALFCPIVGIITYYFADWWMMASFILFSTIELLILVRLDDYPNKLRDIYIFDKKNIQSQIKTCKSIATFLKWIGIITFILNFYPIVFLVFDMLNYSCGWDGGTFFGLSLWTLVFILYFKFHLINLAYGTCKNFDTLITENNSYKQILNELKYEKHLLLRNSAK